MDRFTPCVPKPTEQRARYKFNKSGLTSQKDLLQQLSASISLHEDRLVTLTRNLDINFDNNNNADCASDASDTSLRFPYGTPVQHNGRNSRKNIPDPRPRPGRLSPSVLEMVFSPNNVSGFSAGSSGADTSYDSGLYRWLGVGDFPVLESSPRPLRKSMDLSEHNDFNANTSTDSSRSVYSQSSLRLSSSIDHNILPLSPPATVRPPFVESLERDRKGSENSYPPHTGNSGPPVGSSEEHESIPQGHSTIFHEFAAPFVFLKNISLQHYLPSATVLRHFQRVIDELRGKYAPSDQGNKTPSQWKRRRRSNRQSITPSLQSSHDISASLSLQYKSPQELDVAYLVADIPLSPQKSESRTTRELYIELAGILFEQVAQDEVKIEKLKGLAERLDILAQKRRTTALVICTRGKANPKNHV